MADLVGDLMAEVASRGLAAVASKANGTGSDLDPDELDDGAATAAAPSGGPSTGKPGGSPTSAKDFFGELDKEFGDFFSDFDGYSSSSPNSVYSCRRVLYQTVSKGSNVRLWDVLILIPNLMFLLFLLSRLAKSRQKLLQTNAPVLGAFHHLVLTCSTVSVLRCAISIGAAAAREERIEEVADKVLWLALRAFLLATESSVLSFALLSGHVVDSRSSIKRVVAVASLVSAIFVSVQAGLELGNPDPAFNVPMMAATTTTTSSGGIARPPTTLGQFRLFGHGGMLFWMLSSVAFAAVYAAVLLMPILPCCQKIVSLPHKKSFYYYAGFLLVLNSVQAIGCGVIYFRKSLAGLCYVNLTTFVYFTAYPAIVYFTFLANFFCSPTAQPTLLFAYRAQLNDQEGDECGGGAPGPQFSMIRQSFSDESSVAPGSGPGDELLSLENNGDTPIIVNGGSSSFDRNRSQMGSLQEETRN